MDISIDGQIILDLKNKFENLHVSLVGSFPIPSVKSKDIDILIYREVGIMKVEDYLRSCGYEVEGENSDEYPEELGFKSLRKGVTNCIITPDIVFYNNFRRASQICKELDLKERSDRVLVHKIIFNGVGVIDQESDPAYIEMITYKYREKSEKG